MGQWSELFAYVPPRLSLRPLARVYATRQDGFSLRHLLSRVGDLAPTFLLVRLAGQGPVAGAFLTASWDAAMIHPGKFVGTGESFVFFLDAPGRARVFPWAGLTPESRDGRGTDDGVASREPANSSAAAGPSPPPRQFMAADAEGLRVGGADARSAALQARAALVLDADLQTVHTAPSPTFRSPALFPEAGTFPVGAIEVWAFADAAA